LNPAPRGLSAPYRQDFHRPEFPECASNHAELLRVHSQAQEGRLCLSVGGLIA
jgi:hypothetical protein